MPDSALEKSLAELGSVLKTLNEESNQLNTKISDVEKSLREMNPGFEFWLPDPIPRVRVNDPTEVFLGIRLGFRKLARGEWGLWVHRGRFCRQEDDWREVDSDDSEYVPLSDATRDERAAAVGHLLVFIAGMTDAAKERLQVLRSVTKGAR